LNLDYGENMKELDARNLACPAPVLMAKAAIEKDRPAKIKIIVDNDAARQNVSRFLGSVSYAVSLEMEGDDFHVIGTRPEGAADQPVLSEIPCMVPSDEKIMLMIATDRMGYGDDMLGRKLMVSFIKTLKEMGPDLWRLVFVNNGVKLTVSGSEVLHDLQGLESTGIHILVCGTCLTHFNLLDEKQVGETTNMLDIVTSMQLAGKVINI
jgi:selenium metabolism protein YedF